MSGRTGSKLVPPVFAPIWPDHIRTIHEECLSSTHIRKGVSELKLIIVLGPPASGKGTQCKRLAGILKIPHVSTGDLLRGHVRSRTTMGRRAEEFIKHGELVPDELVMAILCDRLVEPDCVKGVLLDGFPRNERQAELLDVFLRRQLPSTAITMLVFLLVVPESVIIRRIATRRTCSNCGKTFRAFLGSSRTEEKCDVDGGPLLTRDDDREETVKSRLQVFEEEISSIVGYYSGHGRVININGDREPDEVSASLISTLFLDEINCSKSGEARKTTGDVP
jgi:adenylate kinase